MNTSQISTILEQLASGGQSAPLLVSEERAKAYIQQAFSLSLLSLEDVKTKSVQDFFWYDCSDRAGKFHGVEKIRDFTEKLYQRPAGDIMIALFLHIDHLTSASHNALLKIFEDVPNRLLILTTSTAPEKIIPTLQSRIIRMDSSSVGRGENPLQSAIDDFCVGKYEGLFSLTLGKEFKKEQALWIVTGLQNALLRGTLSVRHAHSLYEARMALETTNTISKYIIDQLLISLLCE